MPTIVMTKWPKPVDGSVKAKAMTFLEKLSSNDATPGLHIEPILNSPDARVRTGRVDQFWRAVVFLLQGDGERYYVVHGVFPHDEAISVAGKIILKVNPINGMPLIEEVPDPINTGPVIGQGTKPQSTPGPESEHPVLAHRHRNDLAEVLGLPADVVDGALIADEDTLQALIEKNDGWIGNMLLDLLGEDSISTIADRYAVAAPTGTETDEDLLESLKKPGAKSQFAFIEDQDELRRVIESGDFGAWRIFLHPEQRKYVEKTYSGPFRLSGGAGTGKTVVLVHRARRLSTEAPEKRIVLTTFTTNLADALRESLAALDPTIVQAKKLGESGVHIAGVDAMAAAVIRQAGQDIEAAVTVVLGDTRHATNSRTPNGRWGTVVAAAKSELSPSLANDNFLESEYLSVVLPNRIHRVEEYLKVRRPGRGVALDRSKRQQVWDLFAAYRAQNRLDGTLDFAEASAVAAAHLELTGPVADHVLVDEGQDLSPLQWQMLRAMVAEGVDDMFIAEDSHQRIYGRRVVLGRHGVRIVGRSQRLTLNYRTTAQNLRYALSILDGGDYIDLEEVPEVAGYRSARSGPAPKITEVESLADELKAITSQIEAWRKDGAEWESIAVLVPDKFQRQRVVKSLTEDEVPAREIDKEKPVENRVSVMTMHRAKGTEFPRVILGGHGQAGAAEQERLDLMSGEERADAALRSRSLVYVAVTRARDEVCVVQRPWFATIEKGAK